MSKALNRLASQIAKEDGVGVGASIGVIKKILVAERRLEAKAWTKKGEWRKGYSPAAKIFLAGKAEHEKVTGKKVKAKGLF